MAEEAALAVAGTRKCGGVYGPALLVLYVGWMADAEDTGHSFGNLENPAQVRMNEIVRGARLLL
jgi:hypothetical protein